MSRTLALSCGVICASVVAGCGGSHHSQAAPGTTGSPGRPAAGLSDLGARSTLAGWRSHVGHGTLWVSLAQKLAYQRAIRADAQAAGASILNERVLAGSGGAALYLDLASPRPIWTLRHLNPLVGAAADGRRFPGGWAIRLENGQHRTVWIAGHAGNEGFVGSATHAIDSVSPVSHG